VGSAVQINCHELLASTTTILSMKTYFFVALIVLLACVGLYGGEADETRYSVCGSVKDVTGRPVSNALIHLYGPNLSKEDTPSSPYIPAKVDADGSFKYDAYVPKGTYWLAVCPHNANESVCTKRLKNVVVGPKHSLTECDVSVALTADADGVREESK
jgi:hypothetical protein